MLLLAILFMGTACDPGALVRIENASDAPVEFRWASQKSRLTGDAFRLEPGQMVRVSFTGVVPSNVSYVVEARDLAGNVIFCNVYSLDDPDIRNLTVVIRRGEINC